MSATEKPLKTTTTNASAEDGDDSPVDHKGWIEATDWDEPLKTAVLYKSVDDDETKCGHAIQWKPNYLVNLKHCPICNEQVSMICDGGVVSAMSASTKTAEKNDDDDEEKDNNIMTCKFGKQIYRLSIPSTKGVVPSTTIDSSKSRNSVWGLLSWLLSMSSSSPKIASPLTAQDRIQYALGLIEGFRILHKGKVVYPPSSSSSSSSGSFSTNENTDPIQISKRLLETSQQEWNTPKGKKFMVVMGTQHGKELSPLPPSQNSDSGGIASSLLLLPLRIVSWTIKGTYWLVVSFLQPFLPEVFLPYDSSNTRQQQQQRQDRLD